MSKKSLKIHEEMPDKLAKKIRKQGKKTLKEARLKYEKELRKKKQKR